MSGQQEQANVYRKEGYRLENRMKDWIERLCLGKLIIQLGETKSGIQDMHNTMESTWIKRWGLKKSVMLERFLRSFRILTISITNFYRKIKWNFKVSIMGMEHYERNCITKFIFKFILIWMQNKQTNKQKTLKTKNAVWMKSHFGKGLFFQKITELSRKSCVLMG